MTSPAHDSDRVLTEARASLARQQAGGRRVQYFMFMQVIETETSAVRWQNKAAFTKALINQD